jgi:hypothetical protein
VFTGYPRSSSRRYCCHWLASPALRTTDSGADWHQSGDQIQPDPAYGRLTNEVLVQQLRMMLSATFICIRSMCPGLAAKAKEHNEAVAARYEAAAAELERLGGYGRAEARRVKAAAVRADRHIFVSERRLPWTPSGLQSALRRFNLGFQFRQLRLKAETDKPGVLGHTGQMRERTRAGVG